MPLDYSPLIAIWPGVSGADRDAKLATLAARTELSDTKQDVQVSAVEGYLRLNGKVTAIEAWLASNPGASMAKVAAAELLGLINSSHVKVFEMSDPTKFAAIEAFLNALVADPPALLTADHVADLLAMADVYIPWHIANGLPNVINENDLAAAGLT